MKIYGFCSQFGKKMFVTKKFQHAPTKKNPGSA